MAYLLSFLSNLKPFDRDDLLGHFPEFKANELPVSEILGMTQ